MNKTDYTKIDESVLTWVYNTKAAIFFGIVLLVILSWVLLHKANQFILCNTEHQKLRIWVKDTKQDMKKDTPMPLNCKGKIYKGMSKVLLTLNFSTYSDAYVKGYDAGYEQD